jgi:exosome complex component RRP41
MLPFFVRRSLEIAAFIRQTFEPVIFTTQFPKTQISIYLQIFQNDGGTERYFTCLEKKKMILI